MRIQALLTALMFGVAFAPLVLFFLRTRRSRAGLALAVLWLAGIGALYQYGRHYRPDLRFLQLATRRPIEEASDGYVSSDKCQACHPDEYGSWHDSYHRTMTQVADPDSIAASFERLEFSLGGAESSYELRRIEDVYWVTTNDPSVVRAPNEGSVITRPLALVTGSHHQQVFWMLGDGGRRMQLFPFAYRVAEERWAPYMSLIVAPESVPLNQDELWNRTCLRCHTTHPRVRDEGRRMDTQVGEFGIACEACHGPGERHVEANRNPLRRYALHLGDDEGDPTITQPARLSHERTTEVCGVCHGLHVPFSQMDGDAWRAKGWRFRPGEDLSDSRKLIDYRDPDLSHPPAGPIGEAFWVNRYWEDGVLRVSGREFTAIRETRCYLEGELSCLSCHELHRSADDPRPPKEWADDMLIAGYEGRVGQASNEACLQCHEKLAGKETAHSHHVAGSEGNSCYNCHMPYDSWGLLKATRNHRVASPDVRPDLAVGRPNACNLCHLDRSLEWTAQKLEEWYGIEAPTIDDEEQRRTAAIALQALRGDGGQRAVASWAMGWKPAQDVSGTDWMTPYLAWLLEDPYGAVRTVAGATLEKLPNPPDVDVKFFVSQPEGELLRPQVIEDWRRREVRATAATHPAVLLDEQGDLREDRLRELRSQRDDRPVALAE